MNTLIRLFCLVPALAALLQAVPAGAAARKEWVTVVVSAAGDCTLGRDLRGGYSNSIAYYFDNNEPDYFFRNVAGIFAKDDLTIVNLEGPLTDAEEAPDKQFIFKGPPEYIEILNHSNVNAVNLANNHSRDYGERGYNDTVELLKANAIGHFGIGTPCLMEVKGVLVGMLGYSGFGTHPLNVLGRDIDILREQGAALVIVSFHWGIEREYYPSDTQERLGRGAIDRGADLVIGHHPHVLQGIEKYKGKYIVYSLGNFCYGGNRNPDDKDTMIFRQAFTFVGGKLGKSPYIDIIPARISSAQDRNNFQPTPLYGLEGKRVLRRIFEFSSPWGDLDNENNYRTFLIATRRGGY
ncbi:MAG: CapA family protein [Defluviitaleaceae bacterium]|nr:CapA family protein [Defluviitaleaceae bacterium]